MARQQVGSMECSVTAGALELRCPVTQLMPSENTRVSTEFLRVQCVSDSVGGYLRCSARVKVYMVGLV